MILTKFVFVLAIIEETKAVPGVSILSLIDMVSFFYFDGSKFSARNVLGRNFKSTLTKFKNTSLQAADMKVSTLKYFRHYAMKISEKNFWMNFVQTVSKWKMVFNWFQIGNSTFYPRKKISSLLISNQF